MSAGGWGRVKNWSLRITFDDIVKVTSITQKWQK
jgi:hypothetical protein